MDALPGSTSLAARAGQHVWSFSMGSMQPSPVPMTHESQHKSHGSEPAKVMVVVTLLPWSQLTDKLTPFCLIEPSKGTFLAHCQLLFTLRYVTRASY